MSGELSGDFAKALVEETHADVQLRRQGRHVWAEPSGPGSEDPHGSKDKGADITSASQCPENDSVGTWLRVGSWTASHPQSNTL